MYFNNFISKHGSKSLPKKNHTQITMSPIIYKIHFLNGISMNFFFIHFYHMANSNIQTTHTNGGQESENILLKFNRWYKLRVTVTVTWHCVWEIKIEFTRADFHKCSTFPFFSLYTYQINNLSLGLLSVSLERQYWNNSNISHYFINFINSYQLGLGKIIHMFISIVS